MKSNSALQYLWARHRITLLSDYNSLHNDEARVKEVTRLGLTYNLLTAYTSFVAIDTEGRLVNGEAVTVKQPLPLPEGVSDYAVGRGGMVAQKAMSPLASLGLSEASKSQAREQECKDERLDSKQKRASVEIGEILVTNGLDKQAIQNALKQELPSIQACYQKALDKQSTIQGEAAFQVTIDSKGRVTKVSLISSKLNDKNLEHSIIQKIKEITFPLTRGVEKANVTISFILKAS
jgi:Ca-activated chloride channel family protein